MDFFGVERGSLFFSLTKESLESFSSLNTQQPLFIHSCFESYWEPTLFATGPRPSYEELFPFSQLKELVADSFLSSTTTQWIKKLIDELELAVKRLYSSSRYAQDSLVDDICNALMAYYNLFWHVLKDSDMLLKGLNLQKDSYLQEGRGSIFLRMLLNLGCYFRSVDDAGHIAGIVTPFAPRYLSAILETSNLLIELSREESEERRNAEIEILNTFVSRFLRWFLMAPDGRLCHAAARPMTSFPQEWGDICIIIRPITDYSSYEGISELRLFEKIRYEIKRRAGGQEESKNQWDSIRILIAGDIDANQFLRFGRMLEGWLIAEFTLPASQDSKIAFSVFTDNCSFDSLTKDEWETHVQIFRWLHMEYYPMAELFESPKSLERQVNKADLLFFLDSRQLYGDFYVSACSNLSAFFQQTAEPHIDSFHKSVSGHVLSPNNPFFQVQNLLLGTLYGKGETAMLKKRVSTTQLNYIKTLLNSQNKTAYFYYSDLDAAQDLYWREDCFVCSEDYGGKRMVILRYGGKEEPPLETALSGQDKIIVFDLWQFIKHCNLRRVNHLMEYFKLGNSGEADHSNRIYLLSKILIGVDYSDWPNSLHLTYSYPADKHCFEKAGFVECLRKYLDDIIVPCFQPEMIDIYHAYLRKCIASFLYSDAKSVDDLLFIHIFKRRFSLLRGVSVEGKEDYDRLTGLQPEGAKYSGKRFYQEVMIDYDKPYCYVADQHRKLALMKESGNLQPAAVFQNIRKACEKNQYSESNLYRNCIKWLGENDSIPS